MARSRTALNIRPSSLIDCRSIRHTDPLLDQTARPIRLPESIKHSWPVATAARAYLRLRTGAVEKFVFTATTGRSGTLTLAKLFSAIPRCFATHEPYPIMNGAVLKAASFGDAAAVERCYWRIKSQNIRRASIGHRYYLEANHEFVKTFIGQAARDFKGRIEIIHLVRPPTEVAMSIYCLQDYPGTQQGNEWWLDHRAPGNLIRIAPLLERDSEFSHPFYKALWYWYEVEARIRHWQRRLPEVAFHRLETAWLGDRERILDLMRRLGIEAQASDIDRVIGSREHGREQQKTVQPLPAEVARSMLELFEAKLRGTGALEALFE
jgi:hypothetical protein